MADNPKTNVVEDRWLEGVAPLRRDIKNYWTNTSFFIGEQWVYWSTAEDGIRKMLPNKQRSRVTRNHIKRSVRVNLGKLLRNELYFDVSPSSADDAAVKGAQAATTALANARDCQNWENVRAEEVLSTQLGGTAAVCIEWDPAGYQSYGVTEQGRPYGDGDVLLTPMSIIEFVVQPGVKDAEKAQWWIKATAEDPLDVQKKYNLPKLPEADATTALGAFEQRIIGAAASESGASRFYQGRTMVRTMFERPSRENAQGRVVTVVNDKIVQDVKWPFDVKDRLNLFVFRDMHVDGRWTGESMVTDAVPIQQELNLARSIIMEHLKKAGNARLWVPDETIDEEQLTDDPGQPVFYSPTQGGRAEWASPPPLPQWEVNYPEQAAAEIDDILGVHDISRGDAPKGVEAGTALALLAERDDTPLSVFARDQAEGWGKIGTFVLKCYEQFVTQPREMTVKQESVPGSTAKKPYSIEFTGEMLHGQTKAKVPLEATLPTSRAVSQARADSLMQMGAFGTPPDMRLYVKVADLPDKSQLLAALSADADKAQRSCEKMFRGEAVVPREFDNHGIAIAEANAQRKSERYEQAAPDIQQLFDNFVKAHEVMAAEQVGRQEMQHAESPNLAAAPQADGAIGSAVPPAQSDLGSGGAPPLPLQPGPSPQEIAAMAPPPAPAPEPAGRQ